MTPDVDWSYAQVRLQAHHAARPDEAQWRRLFGSRSLAHFLLAARRSALARWVEDLEPRRPLEVERALAAELVAYVHEVAGWLPSRWRPAVRWTTELVEAGPELDASTWSVRWRRRWPTMRAREARGLDELHEGCMDHRRRLASADPSVDSWVLRHELGVWLTGIFRRRADEPAAAFAHLALVGLDVERLRGAVIRRLVLPGVRSTVAWV